MYAHLADVTVEQGAVVKRGDKLGTVWDGDDPTWIPHVHLEYLTRSERSARDPLRYLEHCVREAPADVLVFPVVC